jgi:tetratricopeptide (TPR) repeat protein
MKSFRLLLLNTLILIPIIAHSQLKIDSLILEYHKGNYSEAIAISEQLLSQKTDSFQTFYYRGLSEQALCRFKEADSSFNQALSITTDKIPVLFSLGICQESAENDDQALKAYTELLSIDSLHVPSKVRMASIYKSQKEFGKAIETYSELVQLDSTNGYFYAQLAYCCSKFGFNEPVIPYYLKAVELNPSDMRSINELISELVETKQFEDARYYCDSFLIFFPNDLKLLKQQAFISAIVGNNLDAVRQFAYIVSLGDSSQFTCKNYGQSLFNNGQYAESVYWLDLYLKNQPDDTKNHFIMGLACQKDYQFEKSLFHLDRALTLLFDRSLLARIYEENGNTYSKYADYCGFRDFTNTQTDSLYKKALENYLEAESINPDGIAIYKTLGRYYLEKRKNSKKALIYYEKYQERLNPQRAEEYELEWLAKEINRLKEEIHFMGNP